MLLDGRDVNSLDEGEGKADAPKTGRIDDWKGCFELRGSSMNTFELQVSVVIEVTLNM